MLSRKYFTCRNIIPQVLFFKVGSFTDAIKQAISATSSYGVIQNQVKLIKVVYFIKHLKMFISKSQV